MRDRRNGTRAGDLTIVKKVEGCWLYNQLDSEETVSNMKGEI